MAREYKGSYRSIYTRLYDDKGFQRLKPRERDVLKTLRTCPATNLPVLYRFTWEELAVWTGYTIPALKRSVTILEQEGWVVCRYPCVWVRNGLKYDPTFTRNNPQQVAGVHKALLNVPSPELIEMFLDYYGLPRGPLMAPDLPPESQDQDAGTGEGTGCRSQEQEKEEGTLPQGVKDALARATALRPLPPDKFFSEMVKVYGETDLAKQLIECHVYLTGKPDKKPKSARGCQSRIAKWMLKAEEFGKLGGTNGPGTARSSPGHPGPQTGGVRSKYDDIDVLRINLDEDEVPTT